MDVVEKIVIPILAIFMSVLLSYLVTIHAIRTERNQGSSRLLEIIRRYFISFINTIDMDLVKIRTDPLSKRFYQVEISSILNDLEQMSSHPYYFGIVTKFPLVSMLILFTRRELVRNEMSDGIFLDNDLTQQFLNLHEIILSEFPKLYRQDIDEHVRSIANAANLNFREHI
jgi:hypothetical protein